MVPLVVIRPEPGCAATVSAARDAGLDPQGFPLFAVTPRSWSAPPPDAHDALLLGSANAVRHAGPGLAAVRHLPAYAVGDATADVARAAGITVIGQGQGGLQSVLGQLDPAHRRLLRLAGEERIALTPPAGVTMAERVVYASRAQPMPAELVTLLGEPALVALHSAEAANHFAAECVRNGLRRARLRLCALGPRIAAAAGDGWGEVAVAADTSERALLALARQMCQDPWGKTNSLRPSRPGMTEFDTYPRRPGTPGISLRAVMGTSLLAFIGGAALIGWLAYDDKLPLSADFGKPAVTAPAPKASPLAGALPAPSASPSLAAAASGMDQRIAALEQRLARLDLQAAATEGNTARAEALLVALATRRAIERGAPLGYLENQLKLRFGEAQANAVATLIDNAQRPVSIDKLNRELEALAPTLLGTPANESGWQRFRRELSGLFVVHRGDAPSAQPDARFDRARLMLRSGQVESAMAEIERLPGARDAGVWLTEARRYASSQKALDLIETAALLEPEKLKDATGVAVQQPGPGAPPASGPAEGSF